MIKDYATSLLEFFVSRRILRRRRDYVQIKGGEKPGALPLAVCRLNLKKSVRSTRRRKMDKQDDKEKTLGHFCRSMNLSHHY
jgi:hypothetical protein